MPALVGCNEDLIVLIEAGIDGAALSLILNITQEVSVSMSVRTNENPSPIGTSIIDGIIRERDRISFSAISGCNACDDTPLPILFNAALIKKVQAEQVYNNNFFTILWNTGVATNMALISARLRQTQQDVQIQVIDFEFEAAPLAGNIAAPSYEAGGVIGF